MNTLVDWLLSLTPHGAPFFDTYAWLINTAIYTTVTALFIILFKLIFKNKIKARWHFLIWAILLIRLVVPVLPSAPISVFNAVRVEESVIEHSSYQTIVTPPNTRADDPDSQYPVAQAPHSESNGFVSFTEGDKPGESVTILNTDRIVLCIWLGGTVILLGYFITVLAVYRRRLKKQRTECSEKTLSILNACKEKLGIKRSVRLYFADTTPVLIGLFKPSIYISNNYVESELEAVIIHELCHMKHLDVLWSGIAAAVLCLNWYNPVIWISFFMFKRDIEVYCDERTLKYIDDKQSYAMLLLNTAGKKKYVLGTSSLQSGKSDVKRRIRYLSKFKKPKVFIIVIALVLTAAITVGCLTNANNESAKQNDPAAETTGQSENEESHVTYSYDPASQTLKAAGVGEVAPFDAVYYHGSNADITHDKEIPAVGWIEDYKLLPNQTKEIWDKTITGIPKTIVIGEGATVIGENAFSADSEGTGIHFEQTEKVILPDSLKEIKQFAFSHCESLYDIELPKNLTMIDSGAFFNCRSLKRIAIPDGIEDIGNGAFSGCESLEEVKLGSDIIAVNSYAFYNTGLKSIDLTSLLEVGECAFYGCNFTSVTIPDSVFSIGEKAFGFNDDGKIEGFTVKGTKGTPAEAYAKEYGFTFIEVDGVNPNISYSYDSESLTLNITGQGDMNDYYWSVPWHITDKIETIIVGEGITSLCSEAFDAGLIQKPDTGNYGFQYTKHVDLPDSLKKIGDGAFAWNFSLTEIVLPKGLTEIGNVAFVECINLKSLDIPDGVNNINPGMCYGCKALDSVKLGKNTETIGDSAFYGTNLHNIDLPDTVATIMPMAFYNCKMTSVTIPKSVKTIGDKAFGYVSVSSEESEKVSNFTINGYVGSAAERYAKENGFKFEAIEE